MMILFVVLSFVMVFILIWQQIQHKKLVREIDYITSRLDTISVISENGFVLIPTDNDSIKKLSAALNKLLQDFYTKKSQFEQSKQAMAKVLTNISHDIRTPLTVLKGNSEMLSNITNTYSASENVHAMAVKIDQIKTASDGKRRFAFGWIASKYGNTDFGPWEWGGTMNFHEIIQNSKNGELRIKAIPEVLDYFSKEIELKKETLYNCKMVQAQDGVSVESDTLGALLYPLEGDTFALDMVIKPERYHEFGIALHVDKELETGYFLRMNPKNQLVAWDMWPRGEQGRYQWQIKGDVPYQIETARKLPKAEEYRVHIIKEKDICVVYINDEIVLSTRMYNHKDGYAGIYVVQGNVKLIQYKEKRSE